ncbi:MAG TPA: protoglobin domain-containing protein, partial [Phycisphaerae bacterium]|nr:protoglobin domain-containing protein [Phycisphaerae bacterium]
MPEGVFEDMKAYIAFSDEDAKNLASLAEPIGPLLPRVVDRFYRVLQAHPGARQVLTGGTTQVEALRRSLLTWLRGLFVGTYDADYCRERAQIGRTHVRVGLPQHYMFAAMEVLWESLQA